MAEAFSNYPLTVINKNEILISVASIAGNDIAKLEISYGLRQ